MSGKKVQEKVQEKATEEDSIDASELKQLREQAALAQKLQADLSKIEEKRAKRREYNQNAKRRRNVGGSSGTGETEEAASYVQKNVPKRRKNPELGPSDPPSTAETRNYPETAQAPPTYPRRRLTEREQKLLNLKRNWKRSKPFTKAEKARLRKLKKLGFEHKSGITDFLDYLD